MIAQEFLKSIQSSKGYNGQVVHIERIPAKDAVYAELNPPVSGEIGNALLRLGINRLYSHQAEAIQSVRAGENIVVVTSTASGKTLCYNVPVIELLERDPNARALYIYPTKALAQDQFAKIREYGISNLKAATYDGDTPRSERSFIKSTANLVLTNPDMLHFGILPYHTSWAGFFRNLKFVVIDEVHTYRGVFGAHVANIIRRLRRIAEYYGSNPQFLCSSATIGNPKDLVSNLTGVDVKVIDNDGSPSGERIIVFWNPPYLASKGERRSSNWEAVDLFGRLVESNIRTIVFTKARKTAELILRYTKQHLQDDDSEKADRIMAYRAGYRPAERREIERKLFSGELIGVTSTNALEVGVDIGGLDAVVLTGYPGTIASTWQQIGRAGRGTRQSMGIFIAMDNPMDQFLMRNPSYLFDSVHESAILDPQNPHILAGHILCAASELPLENSEIENLYGNRAWEVLGLLAETGSLHYRTKWYSAIKYPSRNVSIRSVSNEVYNIVSIDSGGEILGTVDAGNAFETVHPGAIYLHAGDSYVVTKLDILGKVAYVERANLNYYTLPGSTTNIKVCEKLEYKPIGSIMAAFGSVSVYNQVTHFWRKRLMTDQIIDCVKLDLPETRLDTKSVWFTLPDALVDKLYAKNIDLEGSIHAIEHASIGILPIFVMCDRNDIGGVSHPRHPDENNMATIFIYDGYSGGVGLASEAYNKIERVLYATLRVIEECDCEEGCPSCIQSPKCGNNNQPLDKDGAIFLLRSILSA